MALAAFASGLAGALLGTAFGARAVRDDMSARAEPPAAQVADLARRLEALERSLAGTPPPSVMAASHTSAALDLAAVDAAHTIASAVPTFEAAGGDRVDSPPPPREPEKRSLREREERDRYWAQELTMRLGLTPAQTERVRTIQAELERELSRADGAPGGPRRAARRALERDAELELRAALAPRQLAAYEALDAHLKLHSGAAE